MVIISNWFAAKYFSFNTSFYPHLEDYDILLFTFTLRDHLNVTLDRRDRRGVSENLTLMLNFY